MFIDASSFPMTRLSDALQRAAPVARFQTKLRRVIMYQARRDMSHPESWGEVQATPLELVSKSMGRYSQEVCAMDGAVYARGEQASPLVATALEQELTRFLAPLDVWLDLQDAELDKRLVRTLVRSIVALLEWRNRAHGLFLSELVALCSCPGACRSGRQGLSNLLRSPNRKASALSRYLWQQAAQRLAELEAEGETTLLIWDSSVLEKPESLTSLDLGSVRSSMAQRLARIKTSFSHPPSRPLFAPAMGRITPCGPCL